MRQEEGVNAGDPVYFKADKPPSWLSLPRKDQLIILTLIRLAEPITQTSLQAYMFFMLRSFDSGLSDAALATQAGILSASFNGAQAFTGVIWGGLADKEWMGRKNVLLIGLLGTFVSVIGFGFSTTFYSALLFRTLGGSLNGNVGVMRTIISEIVVEKRFQPKAFLLMPLTYNVGVLFGPLLGGWLQNPVEQFPYIFGPESRYGRSTVVLWMEKFPYALPNIVTSIFLIFAAFLVFFGLEETHVDRKNRHDAGLAWGRFFGRALLRFSRKHDSEGYARIPSQMDQGSDLELRPETGPHDQQDSSTTFKRPQLPYKRIFTRNVVFTFLMHGLFAMHIGSFNTLWFIFLSTPRFNITNPIPIDHIEQRLPFAFTGGLGLPPSTIGVAIGIIGVFGLLMQFGVYSRITHKFGILPCYIGSALLFPIVYVGTPYLVMLPTRSPAPEAADGPWLWLGICLLLAIQVTGRTFALPITQILVNNCSPHPSVLGVVHGMGTSVSAGARTVGPIVWTLLYGFGLERGIVGLAWWTLAVAALLVIISAQFVYEGNGHEIRLNGDD